jgi:surfeit locus 1 family protein
VSLGFWQLDRAAQKRALLDAYGERPTDAPLLVTPGFEPDADWRYRRAEVAGRYIPERQFLLDNRVYRGQVGYHVLTPVRLAQSEYAVLVNRGWVPQGKTRADLPAIPAPADEQLHIEGLIDIPSDKVFVLGEGEDRAPGWPKVLQQIRFELHAEQLGIRLLPMVLLLAEDQPGGFVRDWNPIVIGPERHVGYAVQWFALAAVLSILYFWVNVRRMPDEGRSR